MQHLSFEGKSYDTAITSAIPCPDLSVNYLSTHFLLRVNRLASSKVDQV